MSSLLKRLISYTAILVWLTSTSFIFRESLINVDSSADSTMSVPPKIILNIGSRLELFVDDYLIDHLGGKAELRIHQPEPKEIVIVHDKPWEGSGSGYHSIFKDGQKYRMYYKAHNIIASPGKYTQTHPLFCCYAESYDGIHWDKPNLGLYEFQGSKNNNIVFISGLMGGVNADGGHPAVFKDENPNTSPDALYKAILRANEPRGLFAFKSPDGIHWTPVSKDPIITDGAFDSQNLAFWDGEREEYRAYWRYFSKGTDTSAFQGIRAIRTAKSKDFINWYDQADLIYVDSPSEHLYTNVVKPYYRAPHILIGFPTRYNDRGWSESMRALPEHEHREMRSSASPRYGTAVTEALLMASRDGVLFKRWNESFLRPGIERNGTWAYGNQYIGWHLVETKASIEGAPNELSVYATENDWTKGNGSALRRYTLRLDGFVSVNAPLSGGELITKLLTFTGKKLILNFSSSAAGVIQVEFQDKNGRQISGFALEDCLPIFGDTIERIVSWTNGSDLSSLEGKTVRLRFLIKDADLYSMKFR
jgi:hypothetical protein